MHVFCDALHVLLSMKDYLGGMGPVLGSIFVAVPQATSSTGERVPGQNPAVWLLRRMLGIQHDVD